MFSMVHGARAAAQSEMDRRPSDRTLTCLSGTGLSGGKVKGEARTAGGSLFSQGLGSHDCNVTPTFKQKLKVLGNQVCPRESILAKSKASAKVLW